MPQLELVTKNLPPPFRHLHVLHPPQNLLRQRRPPREQLPIVRNRLLAIVRLLFDHVRHLRRPLNLVIHRKFQHFQHINKSTSQYFDLQWTRIGCCGCLYRSDNGLG